MNHSEEQSKFEVRPVIEQKPFENPAVQSFFEKWCKINDSIQPCIIAREEWEERSAKGIWEKLPDGKQFLYIPKDLRLWEMIGVMETVDRDTFATKPERQDEAKKKLLELGETFQNTGIYISQRLGSIEQGKEIARALAEEFYGYGQLLISGEGPVEPESTDTIASHSLTQPEISAVDRFLAGDRFYEAKQAHIKKTAKTDQVPMDELYEVERQKTLAKFFRVAEKAFLLEKKSEKGKLRENKDHLKAWHNDTPLHRAFLAKVEKAIARKIETPKRELGNSLFRRGMELLQRNMPFDILPPDLKESVLHWQDGEKTLRKALQIDKLKAELETVRQSGNAGNISVKEREIADKIQSAVSSFPYHPKIHNPSYITISQCVNCVGASTLGGALMQEAGLTYVVGDVPYHSVLFLITGDGRVEWRDMLGPPSFNEHITNDMIAPLTVADIVAFSKSPTPEGLMFDVKSENYRKKLPRVKTGQRQYVTIFGPEYGQQIQILNNTGATLFINGHYNEAGEAYRQAVALNPKYAYPYSGLGDVLQKLDRHKEAIEAYRQAIVVNPKYALSYYGLGEALFACGRNQAALEAYQEFLNLADEQNNKFSIKRAEHIIADLQKKITK